MEKLLIFYPKFLVVPNPQQLELKKTLGELNYQKLIKKGKSSKKIPISSQNKKIRNILPESDREISNDSLSGINSEYDSANEGDFSPEAAFLEIAPLEYEIENIPRKELSSIPISEINFPDVVYMIVDKKIELEIKVLNDYPDWQFLPVGDLKKKLQKFF